MNAVVTFSRHRYGWLVYLLCLHPLAVQAAPSFSQAFEQAWQRLPTQQYQQPQQQLLRQAGADWLAEAPSLALDYQQGDRRVAAAEEWLVSVELPLARPGLAAARQQQRQLNQQLWHLRQQHQRWQLAGQLQQWWWDWYAAGLAQQRQQQQREALQQQRQWLALLIRQGERPAADQLVLDQRNQQLLSQQQSNQQRQQELQQQWRQWTGLSQLPDDWRFLPVAAQPLAQHPLLQRLAAEKQLAASEVQQQRYQGFNPILTLGLKHQQALDTLPASDQVLAGIRLEFGQSSSYQPRLAAISQLASQHQQWLDTRQQLERQRASLALALPALQQQQQQSEQLASRAAEQYQSQYQAYQRGNLSGFQWLQIQHSIWQLQQQADEAEVRYQRSISLWNQLQGELK